MSTTSSSASSTTSCSAVASGTNGFLDGLAGNACQVSLKNTVSVPTFFSSLVVSVAVFAIQALLFLIIKGKLPRIYNPRSYLVPERERVSAPQAGLWRWAIPVLQTSNSEFIQKCGLDAYFFLRYLRMLLKIFIPLTILILPILLSVNAIGGRGDNFGKEAPYSKNTNGSWSPVVGLNQLSWSNVLPTENNRYWAHLIMAIVVVVWCCYTFFDELRGYVRLRQAYLASPQHRLRASATTVLVSGIPRKWCTAEALDGLYDVFPGGIRNIWINRNFDELNEKVQRRDDIAQRLEAAQTNLIKNAKKAHLKELKKEAKRSGKKMTKEEKAAERDAEDKKAAAMADAEHISTDIPTYENTEADSQPSVNEPEDKRPILPVPIPVLGRGIEAVETGITSIGKTVFGGIRNVGHGVDNALTTTQGLETSTGDINHRFEDSPEAPQTTMHRFENSTGAPQATMHRFENSAGALQATNHDFEDADRPETAETADSRKLNTVPLHGKTKYAFWRQPRNAIQVPDPFPHGYRPDDAIAAPNSNKKAWQFWKSDGPNEEKEDYPEAYNKEYDPNEGDPLWKRYVKPSNRETMRLPIFGVWALSWIPFVGKKVDTVDYCRTELARLNLEIEQDQREPEKYPLMNSAFIQFNHQVAAHMACQSVSHHIPMQMAPRAVEISPSDVLWNNMSLRWWERWVRTFLILVLVVGLVIGWAVPVAFTGALSNVTTLTSIAPWLGWIAKTPQAVQV